VIPQELASRMRTLLGDDAVVSHPTQLRTYECDGLAGYRAVPGIAVLPTTPELGWHECTTGPPTGMYVDTPGLTAPLAAKACWFRWANLSVWGGVE
jgi:hypothetical protein